LQGHSDAIFAEGSLTVRHGVQLLTCSYYCQSVHDQVLPVIRLILMQVSAMLLWKSMHKLQFNLLYKEYHYFFKMNKSSGGRKRKHLKW